MGKGFFKIYGKSEVQIFVWVYLRTATHKEHNPSRAQERVQRLARSQHVETFWVKKIYIDFMQIVLSGANSSLLKVEL